MPYRANAAGLQYLANVAASLAMFRGPALPQTVPIPVPGQYGTWSPAFAGAQDAVLYRGDYPFQVVVGNTGVPTGSIVSRLQTTETAYVWFSVSGVANAGALDARLFIKDNPTAVLAVSDNGLLQASALLRIEPGDRINLRFKSRDINANTIELYAVQLGAMVQGPIQLSSTRRY